MKRDPFFRTAACSTRRSSTPSRPPANSTPRPSSRSASDRRPPAQEKLDREFVPSERSCGRRERELARAASRISRCAAPSSPAATPSRANDVLADYRARQATYTVPDRARLSIAFLLPLAESERADAARCARGPSASRPRPDGARGVKGGASLEDATADYGSPRRSWSPRNFGYWRGDERLNSSCSGSRPAACARCRCGRPWLALARVDERIPARVSPLADRAEDPRRSPRRSRRQTAGPGAAPHIRAHARQPRQGLRVRYAVVDTAALEREPALPRSSATTGRTWPGSPASTPRPRRSGPARSKGEGRRAPASHAGAAHRRFARGHRRDRGGGARSAIARSSPGPRCCAGWALSCSAARRTTGRPGACSATRSRGGGARRASAPALRRTAR